jgi:hypothetical protein
MALLLIENPPTTFGSNDDWVTFLTRSNGNMLGHGLSIPIFTLTNWDGTTTRPEIAEGSIIEVGGSFYQADADTALTDEGGIGDGTVHIKLIPGAGSPDPLTVVPTLTNDALPAWDANKAGWYDAADKFLPFEMIKTSAVYTVKGEFIDQNKTTKLNTNGDLILSNDLSVGNDLTVGNDIVATGTISGASVTATTGNITTNNVTTQNMAGQIKWKKYYKNLSADENDVFDAVNAWVPVVGDLIACTGQITWISSPFAIISLYRSSASEIEIKASGVTGTSTTIIALQNGDSSPSPIEIMSNFDAIT